MTATITKIQKMFFALGTVNSVTLYDEAHEQAFCEVKSRVLQLNDMLNAYDERSEVSAINRNAGVKSVRVSPETFALIEDSVRFSVLSKGLFDITTRPLSLIWKNAIKNKSLPDYIEVMRAALLSSYRDIILNRDDMSVMLRRRGQELDLGAIAKGYAADEAKWILTEHGVSEAIINLGGTVINLGEMRKIGLQKPFEETGTPFAYLAVGERAVVSSGIYEQGFEQNGKVYHHIINPKTGFPSETDVVSVTLVGKSAEQLDALATTVIMMNSEDSALLLKLCKVEAVLVTRDGRIICTEGLRNNLEMKGAD